MTSISNFGHTGPYRDFKATEMTLWALSGTMGLAGSADSEPLKAPGTLAGYMAGLCAAIATLFALHYREGTGVGQKVDMSIMESIVGTSLAFLDLLYIYRGLVQTRGIELAVHPRRIYPCADGYVAVVVPTLDQWQALCSLMGRADLAEDPRLQTSLARAQNADLVDAILVPWLAKWRKDDLFHVAQESRIAIAPVFDPAELLADEHFAAREFFVETDEVEVGRVKYPGPAFRLSNSPSHAGRAPLLGEHTADVLCGTLGYSTQDIVRLRQAGVI